MQKVLPFLSITLLALLGIHPLTSAQAQLCTGSLGDPVVNITFGAGNSPGPSLKAATTAYTYTSSSCPSDGSYTVTSSTSGCFPPSWHTVSSDHTGNAKGYFMLVNAAIEPADFYLDTVHNLCGGTTYEFASWILNMMVSNNPNCGGKDIFPNITFRIETTDGSTVLGTYSTGNIPETSVSTWAQYGLFFVTPPNVSDVVLRMTNNAGGGCGNDLALDDITFRPCGPMVSASIAGSSGGASINICQDDPTVFNFNASISNGFNTPFSQWQVSTDSGATWIDISGAQTTSYTRQPTGPGVYEYRLAVGEGSNIALTSCRISSNVLKVVVNAKPFPHAANNGPQCERDTIALSAGNGAVYAWTGPSGFTGSGQTVPVDNITPGQAGEYYVTVTNSSGCIRNDSTLVIVYPAPIALFSYSSPTCQGTAVAFSDQSTATTGQSLVNWNWDFGDGSSGLIESPSHVFLTAGSYQVVLHAKTDIGCISRPYIATVIVHDLPRPDFSLPEICLADPFAFFSDSSSIADGSQAQFGWSWNFGDPNANTSYPNSSTDKNPTHKYQAAGPYNVSLTVTSGDGCIKDTTKTFIVNGSFPIAGFSVDNAADLCSNQPVQLTDASSVTPGNIIRTEIYWDYLHDPTLKTIDSTPLPGKKYRHFYAVFSSPATESFELQYVVYSGINCVNQSIQTITINASPQVQFDALAPVCEEIAPYTITQAHEIDGFAGAGAYTGRGVGDEGLFDPRDAGPGLDTLYYTFTASNGCSSRDSQTIVVYPQPKVFVDPEQLVLQGSSLILQGGGSGDNIQFNWTPDSAMDNPHIAMPKVMPQDDITYTLTVTSDKGCQDSASVRVTVLKKPVVPNAFSPNGDGVNDTWVIRYLDEYPGADVQVFNRYGQPVYHAIGYTTPWDGKYKGSPLPVATYYWIINPKNGRAPINGSVTILR
jgi:gliding motility-associated-like protein